MSSSVVKIWYAFMAMAVVVLVGCSGGNGNSGGGLSDQPAQNIVEIAVADGGFDNLVAALQATGLDSILADETQSFTVFAPTDAAFDVLGEETVNALLADPDTLSDILLYHVVVGQVIDAETATSLAPTTLEMGSGDLVAVRLVDGELFINDARVVSADIQASNGVIHVIDVVLQPPVSNDMSGTGSIVEVAVAAGNFTTLVTALQATGLDEVLASEEETFTVFAPTDEAFAALGDDTINALLGDPDTLSDILLYHVIAGSAVDSITALSLAGTTVEMANGELAELTLIDGALFIDGAQVVVTDTQASNGVIHVIDTVMTPPAEEAGSILDVAAGAGSFTTLVAALEATGLDTVLADEAGTFTVFAPTDDAFALLGEETIAALLDDPDTLSDILLYHVISDIGVDSAAAISFAGSMVEMANGDSVTISLQGEVLLINESQVLKTDIAASNGIIHVIDAVLLPPAD